MKAIAITLWILAIVVFYGAFFKLAPYIISIIPVAEEWAKIVEIAVYVLIAYFAGIGIPLLLIIWGVIVFIESSN